jgi:uncharacterized membrane protein
MSSVLVEPWDWALLASAGKLVVMGIYVLLLTGIVLMPKALIEQPEQPVPLWKNLRFWAALICFVQIVVYGILG